MGVMKWIEKTGDKAANKVAKLSSLSSDQLKEIQKNRDEYLSEMPKADDTVAEELTKRLLAASSVEIYNAYLSQIQKLYVPVKKESEYGAEFDVAHNIRYINITKWVTDKKENSLEKLVNVYQVLSNENCNIALVFNRTCEKTEVYLAVINTQNANDNVDIESYKARLADAIRGNFPGAEYKENGIGIIPCLDNDVPYSVASASNIPTEKSEKFISQTIEKLLDGIIPTESSKEYTIILLATPIQDVEERKLRLSQFYSGLAPYSSWQTNFTYNEMNSVGSSATIGVNVGASAGIQNGQNNAVTNNKGETDSNNRAETDSEAKGKNITKGNNEIINETHNEGTNSAHTDSSGSNHNAGGSLFAQVNNSVTASAAPGGVGGSVTGGASTGGSVSYNHGWNESTSDMTGKNISDAITKGISKNISNSVSETTAHAVSNTLGRAVTNSVAKTVGAFKSVNLGANIGASFARASNISATIGKNEGITQSFTNFNIKHSLELLEEQMKRFEKSTALGMWDFAAYVLSEDSNVANNVAHSYLALTQGEESYMSHAAINLWRGDMGDNSEDAKEICGYLRELRHPLFGLNPNVTEEMPFYKIYPTVVTATTSLSGKELAYSLNFPRKSVSGLPVIECAEFGRNVVTYDMECNDEKIRLGNIFHMNHKENTDVELSKNSLASHTFITGSTGSGKSNTIYKVLDEARKDNVKFLVIEPAKGEYKNVFGNDSDVLVFGTNPKVTPLLRINPFSFPDKVHVLEHLDRLIEIFNVCWPMYAAMPAVLKNAVEKAYADCGWDLLRSTNKYDKKMYPTFVDVMKNVKQIIDTSDYDNENKGAYKGSLITRLKSLTNGINGMIFSSDEISDEILFDSNVIVDLSRVGSSETKSLIMGMLVLKLQEYRMTSSINMNAELKHITVLEEAHNILRRTSTEQISEGANILGKSVEMLANAIAEMRTYGEGFIISDQAPGLMDMSVIRNTNTKLIMRLPDKSDRELVGRAANLNDDQITEIAKLPCGVAAVYQNNWVQPVLCKVDKYTNIGKPFNYSQNGDEYLYNDTSDISKSILEYIMDKKFLMKDKQSDIKALKDLVINSKLDTAIKCEFIEYISSSKEEAVKSLRKLVYDLLGADEAIKASIQYKSITDWVESLVGRLNPEIKGYTKQQIDLVIALILYEQSERDAAYTDIYCRFTEIYMSKGGVF